MARAALRHLVVVVPGFGGSILLDADGTPRWGPAFGDIARGMVRAEPLSVTSEPALAVAGVLRTVTVFPPFVLPGYDRLVAQIRAEFGSVRVDEVLPGRDRDLRADVVLFPYDFRFGVRPAALRLHAEIEARLAGMSRRERAGRVIVIGHSMGGLVARYWLGPLGGWRDCRALITLATPHRGVPKALDWLVNGVHLGRVQLHAMTQVSRGWPGVYDLLPQYEAILPAAGRSAAVVRPAIGPLQIGSVAAEGFGARAATAARMHAEIDAAWRELSGRADAPSVTAVFARGHPTPSRMVLAGSRLTITKADPEWLPNAGWRGDGTVPAISAVPPELAVDDSAHRLVPERHLPMAATPAVVELLKACDSGGTVPAATARATTAPATTGSATVGPALPGGPPQPWLGVAIDNAVPAGESVPVRAEVLGEPGSRVTDVGVRVEGRGSSQTFRCERAGEQWQTELPGQRAGHYAVTVSAARAAGGLLRCSDVLEAVAI
jgi:Lecithin:cholesterol acyltransferase